ncbi:DUF512 domain-containing protein [Anoxynatronum sibiricum]|uniref:DUF512 domain-containing protein n=1 Tax=Anoxynatronum sibiricum TaxID=210623 RepID=A0ABU9VR73_9CLOT
MECVKLEDMRTVNIISRVVPGSIASELGVQAGDCLIAINGCLVEDVIDYRFLTADENIELTLQRADGGEWVLEIVKDYDDELGIEFENPVMAETRQCRNKCLFCFIDQMPPGMRSALYVKDDDSRLSFLQGNYITLTNMKPDEIDKMIRYRISPLNISVHTSNPELRVQMLNNRFAGNLMTTLKRFHEHHIRMNLQIVLCPGFNDGSELDRTLTDMEPLAESIISIAVVPVGITKYQKNAALQSVTGSKARQVLKQIHEWQNRWENKLGRKLVYPADEFYLKAEEPWPDASAYEAFYQLENGVGMLASFELDAIAFLQKMPLIRKRHSFHMTIATGEAAAPFMMLLAERLMLKVEGLIVKVIPVANTFFGPSITVSGLVTGQDLVTRLKGEFLGDFVMIPENMLKHGEMVFLDDLTVSDVSQQLGIKVIPCQVDGSQWIKTMLRHSARNTKSRSE